MKRYLCILTFFLTGHPLAAAASSSTLNSDILINIMVTPAEAACTKIRIRLWEENKQILDVYVSPDGKNKFMLGKTFPKLTKGGDYRVVSECLDLRKGGFSNSGGLNFVYDGRPLIFNFNTSSYTISRGSVH
ncbi:hypothetical protein EHF33_05030 [Deinococcus psychrotolerans]|uniref:Uncharacterized protein n=1 Tax=Deinococcus psychrotolerans TaxID=2489213 RepID=A0A3G8Y9Z9_9DEIO|nr:hypothetical protein [Deinococcus psychrotolerans]AZI42188.1 hypothetical protein EHF33_05030 [Deinococcus psychrotolerans]